MAELVANECVNCRTPVGYVTEECLQLPTMCIICAGDEEVMEEWEHTISDTTKPVKKTLLYYYREIQASGIWDV